MIFVTIVPFQWTSLATATRVGIVAEGLVDVPYRIADGQDENDDDNRSLHGSRVGYRRVSFLSSTLLMTCILRPLFSMSSRTLLILLKKSLKAFSRKFG